MKMYRQCVTEMAAAHQRRIEKALIEVMKRKPYSEVTVVDLCRISGLTRKQFYHVFTTKDDVLYALIDHTLLDYMHFDVPRYPAIPKIQQPLYRFYAYWYSQKEFLDTLDQMGQSLLLQHRFVSYIADEEQSILSQFYVLDKIYQREVILFHLGGIMSLVIDWHKNGYMRSLEEMCELTYQLLCHPSVYLPEEQ